MNLNEVNIELDNSLKQKVKNKKNKSNVSSNNPTTSSSSPISSNNLNLSPDNNQKNTDVELNNIFFNTLFFYLFLLYLLRYFTINYPYLFNKTLIMKKSLWLQELQLFLIGSNLTTFYLQVNSLLSNSNLVKDPKDKIKEREKYLIKEMNINKLLYNIIIINIINIITNLLLFLVNSNWVLYSVQFFSVYIPIILWIDWHINLFLLIYLIIKLELFQKSSKKDDLIIVFFTILLIIFYNYIAFGNFTAKIFYFLFFIMFIIFSIFIFLFFLYSKELKNLEDKIKYLNDNDLIFVHQSNTSSSPSSSSKENNKSNNSYYLDVFKNSNSSSSNIKLHPIIIKYKNLKKKNFLMISLIKYLIIFPFIYYLFFYSNSLKVNKVIGINNNFFYGIFLLFITYHKISFNLIYFNINSEFNYLYFSFNKDNSSKNNNHNNFLRYLLHEIRGPMQSMNIGIENIETISSNNHNILKDQIVPLIQSTNASSNSSVSSYSTLSSVDVSPYSGSISGLTSSLPIEESLTNNSISLRSNNDTILETLSLMKNSIKVVQQTLQDIMFYHNLEEINKKKVDEKNKPSFNYYYFLFSSLYSIKNYCTEFNIKINYNVKGIKNWSDDFYSMYESKIMEKMDLDKKLDDVFDGSNIKSPQGYDTNLPYPSPSDFSSFHNLSFLNPTCSCSKKFIQDYFLFNLNLYGDEKKLQYIIINILSLAIKKTNPVHGLDFSVDFFLPKKQQDITSKINSTLNKLNSLLDHFSSPSSISTDNNDSTIFTSESEEFLNDFSSTDFYSSISNYMKSKTQTSFNSDIEFLKDLTNNSSIYLYISIKDNGEGMTDEEQQESNGLESELNQDFFNTFNELNVGDSLNYLNNHGSLLSLQICKEFINYLGGKFYFTSQIGSGNKFEIFFPLKVDSCLVFDEKFKENNFNNFFNLKNLKCERKTCCVKAKEDNKELKPDNKEIGLSLSESNLSLSLSLSRSQSDQAISSSLSISLSTKNSSPTSSSLKSSSFRPTAVNSLSPLNSGSTPIFQSEINNSSTTVKEFSSEDPTKGIYLKTSSIDSIGSTDYFKNEVVLSPTNILSSKNKATKYFTFDSVSITDSNSLMSHLKNPTDDDKSKLQNLNINTSNVVLPNNLPFSPLSPPVTLSPQLPLSPSCISPSLSGQQTPTTIFTLPETSMTINENNLLENQNLTQLISNSIPSPLSISNTTNNDSDLDFCLKYAYLIPPFRHHTTSLIKVLIVDDVLSNRKLLAINLKSKGIIDIDYAEDGKVAVEMVKNQLRKRSQYVVTMLNIFYYYKLMFLSNNDKKTKSNIIHFNNTFFSFFTFFLPPPPLYDLIFMDNSMPNMNGIVATTYLRSTLFFPNFIIGITGNSLENELVEFHDVGADLIIVKPMSGTILDQLIKLILNESENDSIFEKNFIDDEETKGEGLFSSFDTLFEGIGLLPSNFSHYYIEPNNEKNIYSNNYNFLIIRTILKNINQNLFYSFNNNLLLLKAVKSAGQISLSRTKKLVLDFNQDRMSLEEINILRSNSLDTYSNLYESVSLTSPTNNQNSQCLIINKSKSIINSSVKKEMLSISRLKWINKFN